jgi:hypothetical protein
MWGSHAAAIAEHVVAALLHALPVQQDLASPEYRITYRFTVGTCSTRISPSIPVRMQVSACWNVRLHGRIDV